MTHPIHRVVLTGGPCAGKSTSLASISDRFSSLGFKVFVVPEVASMMIMAGVELRGSPAHTLRIQQELLETQLHLEKSFYRMAQHEDKPCLIIYDRGAMDAAAFLEPPIWQALLDSKGWSVEGLRDRHYDAVIHLVSAAIGAESYYTLANNAARSETAAQAAEVDERVKNAWVGHPHLRVIDNSTGFDEKIKKVIKTISNVVGTPHSIEMERKFLVRYRKDFPLNIPGSNTSRIHQHYLTSSTSQVERVRKRGDIDGRFNTYTHTVKEYSGPGKNIETEKIISSHQYMQMLDHLDPMRNPIEKLRQCFLFENKYFELDFFLDRELLMLEIEVESEEEHFNLPPFLEIEKEVTDDPAYANAALARKA